MKKINRIFLIFCFAPIMLSAQNKNKAHWVDSVFSSLSDDEKIAQLMVIRAHSNLGADHVAKVTEDIKKFNVGALCFFQGGPVREANLTNFYQSIAKTPLMITIDAEWGLGMRLDSVIKFPYQLTLGATDDQNLVYRMGLAVGEQCKRMGVQVNYAPVVDVNNNPNNPVIGYRSFGEDKYKVSSLAIAYMKGMQDAGIMACAKHFPGHGDVDVDSHLDLPVISKSIEQMDSLELVPFRAVFNAGIGSVMIAHLSVPAIDNSAHRATSISKNAVTGLLRDSLHFNGLTFTDALEMKGVAKYFPQGEIASEALIAGNDMLCLPASVADAITAIKNSIAQNKLSWDDINAKVKKVLAAKYDLGLNKWKPIDATDLLNDLNKNTAAINVEAAQKTISLLRMSQGKSLVINKNEKTAWVGIGVNAMNKFAEGIKQDLSADMYTLSWKDGNAKADSIVNELRRQAYKNIIISVSNYSLRPGNNYGISDTAVKFFASLQAFHPVSFIFGNVLATKNFCNGENLLACYQDDEITQQTAAGILSGKFSPQGRLPVSVCNFKFGDGIVSSKKLSNNIDNTRLDRIDSIANDAIAQKAFPGCVVLAMKDGKLIYEKAFGHYTYDNSPPMSSETIFDLASVTKISATTVSVMKLYEEGKISLNKTLGDYLPWVKGSNKAGLKLQDIILHQAGLVPFIPFYREVIDTVTGIPNPKVFSPVSKPGFTVRVAQLIYMRNDWQDTMFKRIVQSKLSATGKYVYSDNDFIFLGKIVEKISGMPLNEYVQKNFYTPMGMATTGFLPRKRFDVVRIAPTEIETHFRNQSLQGDVHDEGASMFGGVAGHAGLFSNAHDLAKLYQMLLNGGEDNGKRYLKKETIDLFTAYHSTNSRRGYGYDKPEKDNAIRKDPYPCSKASPLTFGHTGFTGTCVWVDPKYQLIYIFLSNRVYPTRDNNKLSQMNIRSKIQDTIYSAIGVE